MQKKCRKCGTPGNGYNVLTRHHILPRRWFGKWGGTVILCRQCHNAIERLIPFERRDVQFYWDVLNDFLRE